LDRGFDWGIFWNPDEETMCVFGEKLIAEVIKEKPVVFDKILRTNGHKD
jgi:hypothetical protein